MFVLSAMHFVITSYAITAISSAIATTADELMELDRRKAEERASAEKALVRLRSERERADKAAREAKEEAKAKAMADLVQMRSEALNKLAYLKSGVRVRKFGRKGSPHSRLLFTSDDGTQLMYGKTTNPSKAKCIQFRGGVVSVDMGVDSDVFTRNSGKMDPSRCLVIRIKPSFSDANKPTLDVETSDMRSKIEIVASMSALLAYWRAEDAFMKAHPEGGTSSTGFSVGEPLNSVPRDASDAVTQARDAVVRSFSHAKRLEKASAEAAGAAESFEAAAAMLEKRSR